MHCDYYGELGRMWLAYDGKKCTVDGMKCVIRARSQKIYFPYEMMAVYVDVIPVNKKDPVYLEKKRRLGDDWSYDGFSIADEILAQFEPIHSEVGESCFG